MFLRSKRKVAKVLGSELSQSDIGGKYPIKRNQIRRRTRQTGQLLSFAQLEARNLLAGLSFDSVISTESDWPDGKSYGFTAASDSAGNTFLGGIFEGIADFDRHAVHTDSADIMTARGAGDAFIAKYGPAGQFLWARRMGGDSTRDSDDSVIQIATDSAGNAFLTGSFAATADFGGDTHTSLGLRDSFVTKIDPSGNFLWTASWGTENDEHTNQIVVDDDGIVTVISSSSTVVTPRQTTSSMRQFDTSGNLVSTSQFPTDARASKLIRDSSGDLYVSGSFKGTVDLDLSPNEFFVTGSSAANNRFLTKISNDGEFLWAASFISDTSAEPASAVSDHSLAVGPDGAIAVLGGYSGQVQINHNNGVYSLPSAQGTRNFFAKFNEINGELESANAAVGVFTIRSMIGMENGFIATGITAPGSFNPVPEISLAGMGSNDVWIMTLDHSGNITWAGLVGGQSIDSVWQISPDSHGGVLLSGMSASTVFDFNPHPNQTYNVSRPGAFVLKLSPTQATKFYVVDDASINRTFEYAADGSSIENYSLNSGNATPRGAASTVAGDKVWVVDANKKVYVYNDAGALLGSWSAGSLASNATIEGIATNGVDVWLVDARQDRVYRYANAAGRLSGSQNATSNFALNSGNRSPKDIVTDGANLWVVNDSTTDKVFKYTMTGGLVGSWTISSVNAKPTGITIDPSGASQSIWIVDNGTDRVYEYTNSRSRHSGSQSAALTFTLAAGNSNPQGIADPPPPIAVFTSDSPKLESNLAFSFSMPATIVKNTPMYGSEDRVVITQYQAAELPSVTTDLVSSGLAPTSWRPAAALERASVFNTTQDEVFANFDLLDDDLLEMLASSLKTH